MNSQYLSSYYPVILLQVAPDKCLNTATLGKPASESSRIDLHPYPVIKSNVRIWLVWVSLTWHIPQTQPALVSLMDCSVSSGPTPPKPGKRSHPLGSDPTFTSSTLRNRGGIQATDPVNIASLMDFNLTSLL